MAQGTVAALKVAVVEAAVVMAAEAAVLVALLLALTAEAAEMAETPVAVEMVAEARAALWEVAWEGRRCSDSR